MPGLTRINRFMIDLEIPPDFRVQPGAHVQIKTIFSANERK